MNIYPAILTDSHDLVQKQLDLCQDNKLIDVVQIDIVDGYFAENLTINPGDLVDKNFGELQLDFHLLTQEPIDFVREIVDFKDDLPVRSVVAQIEQMSNQTLFVDEVRRYGWKVGFSLNLYTPINEIEPDLWDRLEIIQLMAIEAGFQGNEFNPIIFQKIEELHNFLSKRDLHLEIIVDGGVDTANIAKLQKFGVTSVGVGSALFTAENFLQKYQELQAQLN
jgi:ribulose-phosphate 3-epimerase